MLIGLCTSLYPEAWNIFNARNRRPWIRDAALAVVLILSAAGSPMSQFKLKTEHFPAVGHYAKVSDMHTERLTIRISQELRRKIDQRAREAQKDPSQLVREALEEYLCPSESAYDAFKKAGLIGIVKNGPPDLSTNKKYMDGFGRSK